MNLTLFTTFSACILSIGTLFSQTVSTLVDDPAYSFSDDLIFDDSGNLYCADYSGDAIFKRTPNGTLSTFASGLITPNGLAFDSQGNLFVCDNIGNAIYKLSSTGVFLDTFLVTGPSGILKDAQSDTMIFTTYSPQSNLKKLAPDGSISNFFSGSPLNGPVGLEYCEGVLYLSNFTDRKIFRVEPDTLIYIAQVTGGASTSVGFIACAGSKLLATNYNTNRIYIIDPEAQTVDLYTGSSAGYIDGPLVTAKFTTPNGILANAAGDTIYISEYGPGRLRMITGYGLGTDELTSSHLSMYPNPASNELRISTEGIALPYTLQIISQDGKLIQSLQGIDQKEYVLQLDGIDSELFFVTIESENQAHFMQRIVKVK